MILPFSYLGGDPPMSLPFWMMGEPDTSVVKKGQQILIDT